MSRRDERPGWAARPGRYEPKPWYRQFWPWVLIGLPLTSVVGGVTTLFISMHEPDGLVVDDYYKAGLAINRTLQRRDEAARLGVLASGRVDPIAGDVLLELQGDGVSETPAHLRLAHATRAEHDQLLELTPLGGGRLVTQLTAPLRRGAWDLTLEPADGRWRVTGRVVVEGGDQPLAIRLSP